MTTKRELIEQLGWMDFYREGYQRLERRNLELTKALQGDSVKLMNLEFKVAVDDAERAAELRGAEPYVHLAEDLLTLIPDLNVYVNDDGGWDFAEVNHAAEHKRGKDALNQFETLVSQ